MRYPLIQRLLHWAIALMVFGTLAGGVILMIYDGFAGTKEAFGGAVTGMIYKYHKTFGLLILFAMILRIIVKVRMGKPEYSQPLKPFERIASNAVHGVLYVALVAMPVLGWLGTDAGDFPVQFFDWTFPGFIAKDMDLYKTIMDLHGLCAWVIILCVIAHVAGALKHWLVDKDGVTGRMSLF